ncbi:hypothetical protein [Oleiharenicola lentus]|uniref:hypothetical protein n=1 Tax=Oleiharenicola lentus TaxID=2508720 RepID=UPI003F672F25
MNKNTILKSLVTAAALSLTMVASAQSQRAAEAAPSITSDGQGLIGQTYAGVTYSYINIEDSSVHADSYGFQYNQGLSSGLDGRLTYDYTQSGKISGTRIKEQTFGAALRAFSNAYSWGKPYIEGGAGYIWQKYANVKDDSFYWQVSGGVELQLAPAFTLTPFVQYADAPDLGSEGVWNFGAKANYWVNSEWAVTAGIVRDDDKNTTYTLGTNFRF